MVTRTAIKEAAGLSREEAIEELNVLYREVMAENNTTAALAIRKELHKLHGLYQTPPPVEESDDESETLAAIREHLEPLELGPPETPVVELVRLAVIRITNTDHLVGTPADKE
jgi:hypothetical protein